MLYEVINIKQVKGEPRRRWFVDDYFDLIVWIDKGNSISGFQLCYNKYKKNHALTWHKASGYMHNRIDDGENKPGKYKSIPILVNNGQFNKNKIAELFKKASFKLEDKIAGIVYEKIIQYPQPVSDISASDISL